MDMLFGKVDRRFMVFFTRFRLLLAVASVVVAFAPPVQAQVGGGKLLDELVLGAKKEKELVIGWPGDITPGKESRVNEVFNKRFGLTIKFGGSQKESTDTTAEAILETRQGLTPTYNVLEMPDVRGSVLVRAGATERIENWDALLKAIDPTVKSNLVSPGGPLQGHAFAWGHRQKVLIYNPKMIKESELPKTLREMADPKFKGKFSLSPWVSDAQWGILVYPRDAWLETVKGMGRNITGTYRYTDGIQRMLLGEFPFLPANADYYWRFKKQDPKAPIGVALFEDLNALEYSVYLVRKGSRSPNGAKLFALWAATSEANKLWEDEFGQSGSLALPSSTVGVEITRLFTNKKAKLTSYWDSAKGAEIVEFYTTKEGAEYAKALGAAQRGK